MKGSDIEHAATHRFHLREPTTETDQVFEHQTQQL